MTSICKLSALQISVHEFSASMQKSFAQVFGYDTIVDAGSSPLLVRGEVGAIPIATGEVRRQYTREAYSCTEAVVVPRCVKPLPNPLLGQGEGKTVDKD